MDYTDFGPEIKKNIYMYIKPVPQNGTAFKT